MMAPSKRQRTHAYETPASLLTASSKRKPSAIGAASPTILQVSALDITDTAEDDPGTHATSSRKSATVAGASGFTSSSIDLKSPLIIDLGSFNAKIGLASDAAPRCILNSIVKAKSEKKRQFIGNELEQQCHDLHGLYFINPINSGLICNWDTQLRLFDYFLSSDVLNISPAEHELVLTESLINMHNRRKTLFEVLFECYEFPSIFTTTAEHLSGLKHLSLNNEYPHFMLVDCGHEATTFMPFVNNMPMVRHAKRLDVGGKKLTNLLMHTLSYRYFNVLDCWWTVNSIKEQACFVADDFRQKIRQCETEMRNIDADSDSSSTSDILQYVTLPDYVTYRQPQIRTRQQQRDFLIAQQAAGGGGQRSRAADDHQIIPLCVERCEIGECLFEPRQIGSQKLGIAKACAYTAEQFCENEEQYISMLHNIILTGGGSQMPGLRERLQREVERLSPALSGGGGCVRVQTMPDAVNSAWLGGKILLEQCSEYYESTKLKRSDWQELGYDRGVMPRLWVNRC